MNRTYELTFLDGPALITGVIAATPEEAGDELDRHPWGARRPERVSPTTFTHPKFPGRLLFVREVGRPTRLLSC